MRPPFAQVAHIIFFARERGGEPAKALSQTFDGRLFSFFSFSFFPSSGFYFARLLQIYFFEIDRGIENDDLE